MNSDVAISSCFNLFNLHLKVSKRKGDGYQLDSKLTCVS